MTPTPVDDFEGIDRPSPTGEKGEPGPLVIIHKGGTQSSTALIAALFLTAVAYIVYREESGWAPPIAEADRNRPGPVVEASPRPSIAPGAVTIRSEAEAEPATSTEATPVPSVVDDQDGRRSPAFEEREPRLTAMDDRPARRSVDDLSEAADDGEPAADGGMIQVAMPPLPDREPPHRPAMIVWNDRPAADRAAVDPWDDRAPAPPIAQEQRPVDVGTRVEPPRDAVPAADGWREPDAGAPQDPAIGRRQRVAFLQALDETIRLNRGLRAGPAVDRLCSDYGEFAPPAVQEVYDQLGPRLAASALSLEQRVVWLRRIGLPEPMILDNLSQQLEATIGVRRGPRNRMEAQVYAARALLRVPLERTADLR